MLWHMSEFPHCVCVGVRSVCMCVNGGEYVSWYVCGGSRTTMGADPYLLACLI